MDMHPLKTIPLSVPQIFIMPLQDPSWTQILGQVKTRHRLEIKPHDSELQDPQGRALWRCCYRLYYSNGTFQEIGCSNYHNEKQKARNEAAYVAACWLTSNGYSPQ
ncbi:hypothetical protein FRB91_006437 [Serendipita sp. 411]|nr:hypothetical protein FRC15_010868 [Serendipita sp. 397]KAG8840191.1 hypothetical protein FRB91_006437 [Serendipita sp. 411]